MALGLLRMAQDGARIGEDARRMSQGLPQDARRMATGFPRMAQFGFRISQDAPRMFKGFH